MWRRSCRRWHRPRPARKSSRSPSSASARLFRSQPVLGGDVGRSRPGRTALRRRKRRDDTAESNRRADGAINPVFITHFQSDHTSGLPDLSLTGWIQRYYGNRESSGRREPRRSCRISSRPTGTTYASAISTTRIRSRALRSRPPSSIPDGAVYERNGVKVTAFEVDHGVFIKPAYGYRVDYDGRSVVISGDTRFSENLIEHATGANLIVHEVAMANQAYYDQTPVVRYIMAHHISPTEAGELFRRTAPKLAAFTHFVFLGAPGFPAPTPDELVPKVREKYSGPLALGVDLTAFEIGKDEVRVIQPAAK
ncbi:MAG TPA: MBL fold metallo-hydrolase [Beijerinckiaceae bacterium]|nr:MBL fold metallo-hydrolase [Beijerinckiaceae bacterium]